MVWADVGVFLGFVVALVPVWVLVHRYFLEQVERDESQVGEQVESDY